MVDRAKLTARLAAMKDQLPAGVAARLDAGKVEAVTANGRRGVIIAALYILGASYGQLTQMFGISKSTIYSTLTRKLGARGRAARPHMENKAALGWEKLEEYRDALLRLPGRDPLKLAREAMAVVAANPDSE